MKPTGRTPLAAEMKTSSAPAKNSGGAEFLHDGNASVAGQAQHHAPRDPGEDELA